MIEVSKVHHLGLTVSNLERSVDFYNSLFGGQVTLQQDKSGGYLAAIVGYPDTSVRMAHVTLPGTDLVLELFEYISPRSIDRPIEPANIGNPHLCFVVDDIHVTYDELLKAGVRCLSEPVRIDTGVNTGGAGLYAYDPDGITMEFFQPPAPANRT
jgi:catechol 2,3-dioxygenase-like lactoylglutathione lyase family enzyme